MAGNQVLLTFAGDASKLNRTFDQVGGKAKSFGDKQKETFRKVNRAAVIGSGIVIGAAVGIGKSLLAAGREGTKQDKALAQVFESMGGTGSDAFKQIGDAQTDMSSRLGKTKTDIAAVETKLGTFKNVWKDPVKGAENFNRATEIAFDLEAAGFGDAESNVTQLGKALNDPIKGMSALTRVGVSFSKAEQEKVKQLQKSGDLLGAQEILYSALEDQVGGVAEAGVDSGEKLNAQFENLKDTLGRQLIPAFDRAVEVGTEVADWMEHHQGTVKVLAGALVGLAAGVLLVNGAIKVWRATTAIMTAVQWALNGALTANPIGLIIVGIGLLVAGLVIAYKKSETFRRIVNGAFNAVKNVALAAFGWIKNNWGKLLGILTGPIGIAVGIIVRHKDRILDAIRSIPGRVRGFFSGLAGVLTWPFRSAFGAIRGLWNSTAGGFGFSIPHGCQSWAASGSASPACTRVAWCQGRRVRSRWPSSRRVSGSPRPHSPV